MAIIKQRLNFRTEEGYSTVHLETSSDIVMRADGTSIETAIVEAFNQLQQKAAIDHTHADIEANIDTIETTLAGKADVSHGTHVTYSTDAPKVAGTAAAGSAATVARSDHVHPAQTAVSGNAGSATKLATARTFLVNLASSTAASFNGTANVTPGVTGILPVANGGTGNNAGTAPAATKLATARTIGISGGATGTATAFNGAANITIPVTALNPTKMSAGALPVGVTATNSTDYGTSRIRNIRASTTDLVAGSSALNNGEIYLVYE